VRCIASPANAESLDLADTVEGLKQTFWLLSQVVLAARQDDFRSALKDFGRDRPFAA
jgi:hypothetical protein